MRETKPGPNGPGKASTSSSTSAASGGYIHVTLVRHGRVEPIWPAQNS